MAYRMITITDRVSVGRMSNRNFHVRVEGENFGADELREVIIPQDATDELAKYLLKHS